MPERYNRREFFKRTVESGSVLAAYALLRNREPERGREVAIEALIANPHAFEGVAVETEAYVKDTSPYSMSPALYDFSPATAVYYINTLHAHPDPTTPGLDMREMFLYYNEDPNLQKALTEPPYDQFKRVRVRGRIVNSTKRINEEGVNTEPPHYRLEATWRETIPTLK